MCGGDHLTVRPTSPWRNWRILGNPRFRFDDDFDFFGGAASSGGGECFTDFLSVLAAWALAAALQSDWMVSLVCLTILLRSGQCSSTINVAPIRAKLHFNLFIFFFICIWSASGWEFSARTFFFRLPHCIHTRVYNKLNFVRAYSAEIYYLRSSQFLRIISGIRAFVSVQHALEYICLMMRLSL